MSSSTERVVEAGRDAGLEVVVHSFPAGTKTAADAAAAIGCDVSQIVKSLVFLADDRPILVLVPGDRRLVPEWVAAAIGAEAVTRADLDRVRAATGFVAGGTPPIGHDLPVYADLGLRRSEEVWAAGGTPSTVFPLTVADLERVTAPVWGEFAR